MNINLAKPAGTDIYSISVFNSNSTIIENAFKALDTNFTNINNEIANKYSHYELGTKNINSVLPTGIYGITNTPPGTLPDGITSISVGALLSELKGNTSFQVLFLNEGIFYRWYPSETSWNSIKPINVINNLISTSTTDALSAQQGKFLNDTKLTIDKPNLLDIDNCTEGIYVCITGGNYTGSFPVDSVGDFVLECFGSQNNIVFQVYNDKTTNNTYYRWGKKQSGGGFIYNSWYTNSGGGGLPPVLNAMINEVYVDAGLEKSLLFGAPGTTDTKVDTVYKGNITYNPVTNKVDHIVIDGGTID